MPKFRTKISVVDAIQFQGIENYNECLEFTGFTAFGYCRSCPLQFILTVPTENCVVDLEWGDWITKDKRGKISAYKRVEFEQKYEEVA